MTPGEAVGNVRDLSVSVIVLCCKLVVKLAARFEVVPTLLAPPRIASAVPMSWQPTKTPSVVFIGRAKQAEPLLHLIRVNVASFSQMAVLESMQAIEPGVQAEDGVRVEKRLLYPFALAKLSSNIEELTVVLAGAAELMIWGIVD